MTTNFKVGDRVVSRVDNGYFKVGASGVIDKVYGGIFQVKFDSGDYDHDSGGCWWADEDDIVLQQTLKVGDRVAAVETLHGFFQVGASGVIVGDLGDIFEVQFDSGEYYGDGLWVSYPHWLNLQTNLKPQQKTTKHAKVEFTDKLRLQAIREHNQGVSTRQIAKNISVPRSTLGDFFKKMGFKVTEKSQVKKPEIKKEWVPKIGEKVVLFRLSDATKSTAGVTSEMHYCIGKIGVVENVSESYHEGNVVKVYFADTHDFWFIHKNDLKPA